MLIICTWCGIQSEKPDKEIRRQIKKGRNFFFCCSKHAAHYNNLNKRNRFPIRKKCKYCGTEFSTFTGRKEKSFCSRSHASRGSISELRRQKAKEMGRKTRKNLISVSQVLKIREKWKYEKIIKYLEVNKIIFEIEYEIKPFVYDLALIDKKLLIEFDERYGHSGKKQHFIDIKKDQIAKENGWKIKRIKVKEKTIIEVELIKELINLN